MQSNMKCDRSSQIIEDVKWFMFNDQDSVNTVKNEFGFEHGLKFVTWVGDGEAFIVTDGTNEYRIRVTKEIE